MQINVSQQLKAPVGSKWHYQVSEAVDTGDGDHLFQGEVELIRIDRSLLVKAILHTEIELTCSRCLNLFSYPLTLNIEEEYFPTTDMVTGASLPLPDEPGCFTIDANNILDLTEAIRQYTLLTIPMKPLCREDCAGLCPACGGNLNQGPCSCPPKRDDPRWSALRKWVLANKQESVNEQKGTR
ncbi:MAG: DUF177 domain-containing protein [Chloroflexi bacterium]|nr:DUF177 domain-containing protein [Chloroflexota bacterium]